MNNHKSKHNIATGESPASRGMSMTSAEKSAFNQRFPGWSTFRKADASKRKPPTLPKV